MKNLTSSFVPAADTPDSVWVVLSSEECVCPDLGVGDACVLAASWLKWTKVYGGFPFDGVFADNNVKGTKADRRVLALTHHLE